ncbi:MAG: hypothetical protein HGA38_05740 [Candidatus Moranbacteria bacterium]|nr:hypothetical protein [Candidatus Moranbacteria bacterium]
MNGIISSSNSNPRTLTKGAGTWSLTGTGTVWDAGTSTNLTLADTGTTKLTNNSTSAKTFAGGGMTTYSTLWNATGGTGTVTITGSNAFKIFRSDAGRTNLFTAGTTQTAKAFLLNGSLGNLITLGSASTSPFFLMNTGPWVMASYISVSYSTVTPASGVWYAGPGSTDGGNNSGWNFTTYPNINTVQGDVQFLGDIRSN